MEIQYYYNRYKKYLWALDAFLFVHIGMMGAYMFSSTLLSMSSLTGNLLRIPSILLAFRAKHATPANSRELEAYISSIAAYVRNIELYALLQELLVACFIVMGLRHYYQVHHQQGYKRIRKAQKESTLSFYIGLVIVAFAGILYLYKGHLLYSSLSVGLRPRERALFPREHLFWSKLQWIIVVPISTEILYRGFIFRRCRQSGLDEWGIILLSAVAFAFTAGPMMQPHIWRWDTYKFVLGYTLATIYAFTQRIEHTIMLSSLHSFLMCFLDLSGLSRSIIFWQGAMMLLMLGAQYFLCYEMHFVRRIFFAHSAKAKPEASTIVQ